VVLRTKLEEGLRRPAAGKAVSFQENAAAPVLRPDRRVEH
jgi:hypothetical protein